MLRRFTLLEAFFLLIGTAILVYQLVIVHTDLTLGVLGVVLFCFGYVVSSKADREGDRDPLASITALIRAIRGQDDNKR